MYTGYFIGIIDRGQQARGSHSGRGRIIIPRLGGKKIII